MKTIITEVEDRKGERIQTVAEYFRHRQENIGVRPTYYAGELYLNLPDEAFYHPVTKGIEYVIAELGSIDNVCGFLFVFPSHISPGTECLFPGHAVVQQGASDG